MATPIKITPILQGKDSEQFNKSLSKNKDLKVSSEKKRKMQDLVTKVLSNKK